MGQAEYCLTLRGTPLYGGEVPPQDQCLEPLAKILKRPSLCETLVKEHYRGGVEYSRIACKIAAYPTQDYLSSNLKTGDYIILSGTLINIGSTKGRVESNGKEITVKYEDHYIKKQVREDISKMTLGDRVQASGLVLSNQEVSLDSIQKLPSPQEDAVDISTWQTYRNDEFGFEVRYPEEWELSTRPGFRVIPKNVDPKYGKLLFFDFIPHGNGIGDLVLVVGHTRFSIEEELNAECFPESKPFEIIVGEAQGLAVEGKYLCPPMHVPGSFGSMKREIVVLKGGIFYHFTSYVIEEKEKQKVVDQIFSTFRFVETFAAVCDNYTLVWKASIKLTNTQDTGTLVVCDQQYPGEGHTVHILDGEMDKVWSSGFYSHVYEGPKIIDVENDGIDEVYWASSGCGGTCTGCSTGFHIYSQKYNESFSRVDRSIPKSPQECSILVDQPPEFSTNLKDAEYKIFRDYLENKKFEGENVWGSG